MDSLMIIFDVIKFQLQRVLWCSYNLRLIKSSTEERKLYGMVLGRVNSDRKTGGTNPLKLHLNIYLKLNIYAS